MASSMKILVNKFVLNESNDPAVIASMLNDLYDGLSGIYFGDYSSIELDGADKPDELRKMAETWNKDRQDLAVKLLTELLKKPEFDTAQSYQARKAFDAADNNFGPGVDYAVVNDGQPFFRTLVADEMLKNVAANPENYCVVNAVYDF